MPQWLGGISAQIQIQRRHRQLRRLESRIDALRAGKSAYEQPRRDEQHDRHGYLRNDQDIP